MTDALRRWLLMAGVAVLVLGVAGLSPNMEARPTDEPESGILWAAHAAHTLACVLLGLGMIVGARLKQSFPRAILILAFLTLLVGTFVWYLPFFGHRMDPLSLSAMISQGLLDPGIPLLWGTALLRRTEPGDPDTQKFGRIGAGLVQLAFIFVFISELRTFDGRSLPDGGDNRAILYGLQRVVGLADRILLLWASIESVRTCADADAVRSRALKTHKLMLGWLGLTAAISVLGIAISQITQRGVLAPMWQSVVFTLLPPAAALVVAGRFARGYKSDAPAHP